MLVIYTCTLAKIAKHLPLALRRATFAAALGPRGMHYALARRLHSIYDHRRRITRGVADDRPRGAEDWGCLGHQKSSPWHSWQRDARRLLRQRGLFKRVGSHRHR